jgi:hypothetical protein
MDFQSNDDRVIVTGAVYPAGTNDVEDGVLTCLACLARQ